MRKSPYEIEIERRASERLNQYKKSGLIALKNKNKLDIIQQFHASIPPKNQEIQKQMSSSMSSSILSKRSKPKERQQKKSVRIKQTDSQQIIQGQKIQQTAPIINKELPKQEIKPQISLKVIDQSKINSQKSGKSDWIDLQVEDTNSEIQERVSCTIFRKSGIHHSHQNQSNFIIKMAKPKYTSAFQKQCDISFLLNGHPNIVKSFAGTLSSSIVMQYMPSTLKQQIPFIKNLPIEQKRLIVKVYAWQILKGLGYMHVRGIVHRDMSSQNILVDGKGRVQICDFGSADRIKNEPPCKNFVTTAPYRSPEVILLSQYYTPFADIWSCGVIILQMMIGELPFQGNYDCQMLVEMISVLGKPKKYEIEKMEIQAELKNFTFPNSKRKKIDEYFGVKDTLFGQFLQKIFSYQPDMRPSAYEALADQYFDELRNQSVYSKLSERLQIEGLFVFQQRQAKQIESQNLWNEIIPRWSQKRSSKRTDATQFNT